MKKFLIVFLFFISLNIANAQVDVMAGMGISFISTSSFNDYVNNIVPPEQELSSFTSSVSADIESDYTLGKNFDLGFEYEYRLYSFNTAYGYGVYDVSYDLHSPSLLAYYAIHGVGFRFRFGGGIGYRFISLDEKLGNTNVDENYTASGFGLMLRAQAHTLLGGNFYAYIAGDLRYDLIGEASNGNRTFGSSALKEKVNFNTLAIGLKLGISYLF